MDGLYGDEVREIQFLIAEHCLDFTPSVQQNNPQGDGKRSYVTNPPNSQNNDLAHAIALVLAQTGWCSLIDVMSALQENRFSTPLGSAKNILNEDNLRTELKRLVTHGIVRYDSRNGRYAIDVLFGTLRILFPLMAQDVIRQAGAIGEIALQILYEHHDLPIRVLTNLVYDANPQLGHGAIDRVLKALQTDEWIVQVSSTCGVPVAENAAGGPSALNIGASAVNNNNNNNAAPTPTNNNNNSLNASFGINYAKFLAAYRATLVIKYATENMSGVQRSIVAFVAQNRIKESQLQTASNGDENPAPKLPNFSNETPVAKIVGRLVQGKHAESHNQAENIVRGLCNDGARPLIQQISIGNNNNNNGNGNNGNNNNPPDSLLFATNSDAAPANNAASGVRLNYDNAMFRVRKALMCSEVRARFGLLGQRIVKILFDHHALEDKNIAEEGLISLQDLHQLLLAMQGQGLLGLQELMKMPGGGVSVTAQISANSGPDRSMKQSIFLWRLQERNLLSLVRRRVARSICALRVRMRSEYQTHILGGGGENDSNNSGPRAPENSASGKHAENVRRFEVIQEHLTKSLVALYEELALSTFC